MRTLDISESVGLSQDVILSSPLLPLTSRARPLCLTCLPRCVRWNKFYPSLSDHNCRCVLKHPSLPGESQGGGPSLARLSGFPASLENSRLPSFPGDFQACSSWAWRGDSSRVWGRRGGSRRSSNLKLQCGIPYCKTIILIVILFHTKHADLISISTQAPRWLMGPNQEMNLHITHIPHKSGVYSWM